LLLLHRDEQLLVVECTVADGEIVRTVRDYVQKL